MDTQCHDSLMPCGFSGSFSIFLYVSTIHSKNCRMSVVLYISPLHTSDQALCYQNRMHSCCHAIVQPSFCTNLIDIGSKTLRLSPPMVTLTESYSAGRTIKDRNTGQEVALGCNIALGGEERSEDG